MQAKTIRSGDVGGVGEILSGIGPALTLAAVMLLLIAAIQICDVPSQQAPCKENPSYYQIDDAGRITDGDGRLRGWLRGNEIYSPNMEPRYRLSGVRLEDMP